MIQFYLATFRVDEKSTAPVWIVNPAFVIKNWGNSDVELKVNGELLTSDKDFFVGYEKTHTGTDMVLWIKSNSQKAMTFELKPISSE